MTLACGHTFKMLCFINWAGPCPLCREDVPRRQREGPTPSELRRDAPVPLPQEDHGRLRQSIAAELRPPTAEEVEQILEQRVRAELEQGRNPLHAQADLGADYYY